MLHAYSNVLVELKDWQQLLTAAEQLGTQYPESKQVYLAAFRRGLAYQGLGLFDKAEGAFRETIAQTDTIEAARAQFNIGALYFAQDKFADAAKNFLRVEMLYDYPELSPKALYRAVQAFRRAGSDNRADIYLEKLRLEYKDSEWAEKADTLTN